MTINKNITYYCNNTPDKGSVSVDNQNLIRSSDKELSTYRNKKIGFVFQSFNLQNNYTALENVMLPLVFSRIPAAHRKARALECLETVGLEDRINHKPAQLSGGQRQRVCIARALANRPEMIIADEPTGNLDSKRGAEIIVLLQELNKNAGITIIIITHDLQVAGQADRVYEIFDGEILERKIS